MGGALDPPRWLGKAVWGWSPSYFSLSPFQSAPLVPILLVPFLSVPALPCPSLILPVPAPFPILPWPHPALSSALSCLPAPVCPYFVVCLLLSGPTLPVALPSCPSGLSLATSCPCPSRLDLVFILPVAILPCTNPACLHPVSPYTKHSTRMEWEVLCLGHLSGAGSAPLGPCIDWISRVLGEFYLIAANVGM